MSVAPLTPGDCNLQDFAFMPLDVARLRDSDLAANETPEACWAGVLLWAASWHQVPAASIPNEEKWIAKTAGYAQRGKIDKAWSDVREGALRNWVECSDGRLYHPVVAEKAREAWQAKLEQRWRTECARIKKHNDRHGMHIEKPTFEEWMSLGCPTGQLLHVPRDTPHCPEEVPRETPSKGEGEGEGQGQGDLNKDSEAKASGDKSPNLPPSVRVEKQKITDPQEIIFSYGLGILTNAGNAEKQARSFLGGLRKAHGDDALIDKLRECAKAKPLDPLAWLAAALPPESSSRKLNAQEALEASNKAVAAQFLKDTEHA